MKAILRKILSCNFSNINQNLKRNLSTTEYCLDLIKRNDYENFVCTLLLKDKARSTGIAVRAFNVEISKIPEHVTEEKIGYMRLKFWEQAINSCYKDEKVASHPVVVELNRVIQENDKKLTKRYFENLLYSKKIALAQNTFTDLKAMEDYSEKAVSNIYYLLLEASGIKSIHADHAASHLGKAQGITQLLRGIPITSQQNFIALPQDLLTQHKISHEDIKRCKSTDGIKDCVFQVATLANQHLQKARNLSETLTPEGRRALLPACAVDSFLKRLLRTDCDIFSRSLHVIKRTWMPVVVWKNFKETY